MGLFQSKTTWVAYVGSGDLVPEEDRQSTFIKNILQNNLRPSGKLSTAEVMKVTLATDMYSRARSMMRYAEKEDGYARGFPESTMLTSAIPFDVIEGAFSRFEIEYDSIYSTYLGGGLESQFAKVWLKENYLGLDWTNGTPPQWDEQYATVPIPVINPDTGDYYQADNGFKLDPMVREGIDPGDIYQGNTNGVPKTQYFNGRFVMIFTYTDNTGNEQEYQVPGSIDFSQYRDPDELLIFVRYLLNGEMLYWWYKQYTNTDDILEQYFLEEDRRGSFLPVIVMMEDKVWVDSDPESNLYITTNKMLRRLGTDVAEIKEEYEAQEEEDNSSGKLDRANAEKWDFFIHFAVPIRTRENGALEYLYYYFQQLMDWTSYSSDDYFAWLRGETGGEQPADMMRIFEGGVTGYSVRYLWSFIEKTPRQTGIWATTDPDGTIRQLRPGQQSSILMRREQFNEFEYRKGLEMIFGVGNVPDIAPYIDPDDEAANEGKNSNYFIVTRQHRRQENGDPFPDGYVGEYSSVIIFAPECAYEVNTSDSYAQQAYRVRYAEAEIWNEDAEPDEEGAAFRFPVHYDSLQRVSRMHREGAIQASLAGTVTIRQKQKEQWYAKGFWKWLIIIIAIILIILSIIYAGGAGTEEGVGLIAAMVSATGATGFAAFVLYVVFSFAIGYIISLAGALLGGDAGRIFQLVGVLAMAYSTYASAGFSWTGTATSGFGQALAFLQNVNTLIAQPAFAIVNVADNYGIEDEIKALEKDRRQKLQELKEAYDGVGELPPGIEAFDLIAVFQNPGAQEQPDDFIARCTDPNPGQNAIDLVLEFTEIGKEPVRDGTTGFIESMFVDLAKQRGAA